MPFRQQLAKAAGIRLGAIPASYQILGDVMLLKLPKADADEKKKIAEGAMRLLPYVKSVCEIKDVSGELREPRASLLAGSRTETIHTENGVKYHLDVSQVMFSKGNLFERQRLVKLVKAGEIVVDMFAGIGYFSIPVAKNTKAKRVIAIEKNLNAFRFLKDNIQLNGVKNMDAIWGDCRDFANSVKDAADRVVMGYLPGTEEFLPEAIRIAKNGAAVHFHNLCEAKGLWKKPLSQIKDACNKHQCSFKVLEKRKVKSYKPGVFHVVVDFQLIKA